MKNNIIGRFAPSPTGLLHLGNFRIALINFLRIKKSQGKFILRIDDTDSNRSSKENEKNILYDLESLGITWDTIFRQSERKEKYDKILKQLIEKELVYQCFESPEELELKRKTQLSNKLPPIYDRSALNLSDKKKQAYIDSGRNCYYRLKLEQKNITWNDECHGQITVNTSNVSDPIIKRSNKEYTYLFPSSIDDIDYNITHIVRGNDHITNTAIQIYIMQLLNANIPTFAHLPLIKLLGETNKISKRTGSLSIKKLIQDLEPITIMSYMATIGTSKPTKIYFSTEQMIEDFDISHFSNSDSTIDINYLKEMNIQMIRNSNVDYIKSKVPNLNIENIFWDTIKNNINSFEEIIKWWSIFYNNIQYTKTNKSILLLAIDNFPDTFTMKRQKEWIEQILLLSEFKKIEILKTIRIAITSEKKGPEIFKIMALMSPEVIKERLKHTYDIS